jgi:hypothetical protein
MGHFVILACHEQAAILCRDNLWQQSCDVRRKAKGFDGTERVADDAVDERGPC